MKIWLKKESKDESVTLSFAALSFFVYLTMSILQVFDLVKDSAAVREIFFGSLAVYLGRKSPWFNIDNKLEEKNEKNS